jgi:hypothetical protein
MKKRLFLQAADQRLGLNLAPVLYFLKSLIEGSLKQGHYQFQG